MGNFWFCWCLLTYVGSILCILFVFSCIEKDRLQPVSTGFWQFYCISQTVRPATEKIQNQGNRNRWSGYIRLRPVRFRFFFWSMQLDLQTLDKIHSYVWGPSPMQTPGHKEYYVSFTDDHTRWTHLQLLATKDGVFEAYKNFNLASQPSKFSVPTEEGNTWARHSAHTSHLKAQQEDLQYMIPPNIWVSQLDTLGTNTCPATLE